MEALVPYELGVVVTLATLAVEVVSVVSVEVVMVLILELESVGRGGNENRTELSKARVGLLLISPTHKRAEGRAPVWGSKFTSKRRRTTGEDPAETAVG